MGLAGGALSDPGFLAGILERHKTRLYKSWYQALQAKWGQQAEAKLRLLRQDRRAGVDLFALLLAGLASSHGPVRAHLDPILRRIRLPAPEYSIEDFFWEASSLKATVQQILQTLPRLSAADLFEGVRLTNRQVDDLTALVLQETAATYEYMLEGGARGFCQLDPAGAIVHANREMQRLSGVRSLRGMLLENLFEGAEKEFMHRVVAGEVGGRVAVRLLHLRRPSGPEVPVGAEIGQIIWEGRHQGGFACFLDLSRTVRSQQTILEKHPLGVIKVSLDGNINFANRKMTTILGWADWRGKTVADLAPDDDTHQLLTEKLARRRKGLSDTYNTQFRHAAGHRVPVAVSPLPDIDPSGSIIGSLAFIEDLRLQRAIAAIHQAVEEEKEGTALLRQVAQETAKVIPYDLFSVSIFSKNRRHLCRLFAYTNQGEPPRWDARWWAPPAKLLRWLQGHRQISRIDNLESFLAQERWQELLGLPEIQTYLKAGYRSALRYPVLRENLVVAAVTLSKKGEKFYRREDVATLASLPLDKAVLTALDLEKAKEAQFRGRLIRNLTTRCNNFKEVACTLVEGLADFYHWGNVALFKAEEEQGVLRLLYQKAIREEFRLPDGYTQPLKAGPEGGVLSYVYLNRTPVNIGNVREDPKFRRLFIGILGKTNSELCVPIFTSEGVWLINIEDDQKEAFSQEDLEALQDICQEVSGFLERSWLHHSLKSAFESTSDAVIRTDAQGRIRWVNPAGLRLLGYEDVELRGQPLSSLFKVPQVGEEVVHSQEYRSREVTLSNKRGEAVEVLLSGFDLPEEFNRKVFMAKDLRQARRVKELEYLDAVYHEIAAQMRTPLSLVFSWLSLLQEELPPGPLQETMERLRRQLYKVELCCDRLALYDYDPQEGLTPYHEVLLDFSEVIGRIQEEFPVSEVKRLDFRLDKELPFIRGDLFQLSFCLKTILSYLLRFLPEDNKIEVRVTKAIPWLTVTVTGFAAGEPEEAAARLLWDVALGDKIIRRFIHNHRGIYYDPQKAGEWMVFRFDLPIFQGGN